MTTTNDIHRRGFLKGSAAGAILSIAAPAVIAAEPSKRINVAVIGCGAMGTTHLNTLSALRAQGLINVAAVCDVFENRREKAKELSAAAAVKDFRQALDMKDVDAVVVATPDHWHAPMSIAAADAGKDVYCEKPMTHWKDIGDAKKVVEAIARNKRVMQIGTNGMSDSQYEQAAEKITAGALGKLIRAQASDLRNGQISCFSTQTNDPVVQPGKNLDWDLWLGPAPKRSYEPARFFAFRSFWDYSGGVCTDFFPHLLTPLVSMLGLEFPKRVVASGGRYYWNDGREIPDTFNLNIEYPTGPSIDLVGGLANDTNLPMQVQGQQATLTFGGAGFTIDPQRTAGNQADAQEVKRERSGSLDEHWKDFLEAIESRKKPRSHEILGYRVMAALCLGVRSFRENKVFEFDAKKEQARAL
jgi:predicted dehydrogenase